VQLQFAEEERAFLLVEYCVTECTQFDGSALQEFSYSSVYQLFQLRLVRWDQ